MDDKVFCPASVIGSIFPSLAPSLHEHRKTVAEVVGAFYALCTLMCFFATPRPDAPGIAVFMIRMCGVLFAIVSGWAFYDVYKVKHK